MGLGGTDRPRAGKPSPWYTLLGVDVDPRVIFLFGDGDLPVEPDIASVAGFTEPVCAPGSARS